MEFWEGQEAANGDKTCRNVAYRIPLPSTACTGALELTCKPWAESPPVGITWHEEDATNRAGLPTAGMISEPGHKATCLQIPTVSLYRSAY